MSISQSTLSISEEKIKTIHDEWSVIYDKSRIIKQNFQSLLGKLLYVHKCVAPTGMFVGRILHLFRQTSHKKSITLNDQFKRDLAWFIKFLPLYDGVTFIYK